MQEEPVTLSVELPNEDVAWQLAQFCKRSTFDQFLELTKAHLSDDERKHRAYQMIHGINAVAQALEKQGFAPR